MTNAEDYAAYSQQLNQPEQPVVVGFTQPYYDPNQPQPLVYPQQPYPQAYPQAYPQPYPQTYQPYPVQPAMVTPGVVSETTTVVVTKPVEPQPQKTIVVSRSPVTMSATALNCHIVLLVFWCIMLVLDLALFLSGSLYYVGVIVWVVIDLFLMVLSAMRVYSGCMALYGKPCGCC